MSWREVALTFIVPSSWEESCGCFLKQKLLLHLSASNSRERSTFFPRKKDCWVREEERRNEIQLFPIDFILDHPFAVKRVESSLTRRGRRRGRRGRRRVKMFILWTPVLQVAGSESALFDLKLKLSLHFQTAKLSRNIRSYCSKNDTVEGKRWSKQECQERRQYRERRKKKVSRKKKEESVFLKNQLRWLCVRSSKSLT